MEAEIPKSESAANAHKGHSLMEEHMNDRDSGTRASDSDDFVLPEAGPEMRLELSERDWDALMEDIAHPSLPNAAMLRSSAGVSIWVVSRIR